MLPLLKLIPFIIVCFLLFKLRTVFYKLPAFFYWVSRDIVKFLKEGRKFNYYGLRMFVGRQGAGKSIGMVYYLEKIRKQFPKAKIYTNFDYIHQDGEFHHWRQLIDGSLNNGEDGVIIGWDEVQNDFSSTAFKDFPEEILGEVTQQRKQRMCILGTSQVFTRVVKSLREQCYEVIECSTIMGRWTRLKSYDSDDYNRIVDNPSPEVKFRLHKKWKLSFIQTDTIRNLYDSYAKIQRMSTQKYIDRSERIKAI